MTTTENEESRQMREYGPGNPLVFSHVPKTAGTSLRLALQQSLQPEVFVQGVDCSLLAGYDDLDAISPAARAAFYMSPEELPADATLVAGHIAPSTTTARYPGADHITVLRAPQIRVISQWLHGRSLSEFDLRHWGPSAQAFRVAWLPLYDFLQHARLAPNVDNTITRFLVWPHPLLSRTEFLDPRNDDELFEAAVARLDTFGHVNVAENPAFLAELGAWLGRELPPTRANERTAVPRRRRPDFARELDARTRSLLEPRTRIDVRVWSHVVGKVLPGADPARLLDDAVRSSLERYTQMLASASEPVTLRRVVAAAYGVRIRLDPTRQTKVRV